MKISTGKQIRPVKCVIYGTEGIGKSTFAAQFPDPLFLDLEKGSSQLDVHRVEWNNLDWTELIGTLDELVINNNGFKTIVIDTADAAEVLCNADLCAKNAKASIEDFGYGKGYQMAAEHYSEMLKACDRLIPQGLNVVVIAHSFLRKQELPEEMGSFDRYEMKLSKKVAPLLKEWADMLLFFNYKTYVVIDDKTKKPKAQGGERVVYTTHTTAWDAKNRFGLPEEIKPEFSAISHIFKSPADALIDRIKAAGVSDTDFLNVVAARQPQFKANSVKDLSRDALKWCNKYFDKIVEMVKEDTNV